MIFRAGKIPFDTSIETTVLQAGTSILPPFI